MFEDYSIQMQTLEIKTMFREFQSTIYTISFIVGLFCAFFAGGIARLKGYSNF
ncbi:hypothetical protein KAU08_09930 [bacterium]|nr:hypothetical protein [bacterium]